MVWLIVIGVWLGLALVAFALIWIARSRMDPNETGSI